jgi:hypothetical protein
MSELLGDNSIGACRPRRRPMFVAFGMLQGAGNAWCPGDYVWPGLAATGWDLTACHVYHEECPPGRRWLPQQHRRGAPEPPAIISTREQCEAILGIFCPKA